MKFPTTRLAVLVLALLFAGLASDAPRLVGQPVQDAADAAASSDSADTTADDTTADGNTAEGAETVATDSAPAEDDASAESAAEASPAVDDPAAADTAATEAATADGETSVGGDTADSGLPPGLRALLIAALTVALIALPILVGNGLAKRFGMPDHGWKLSLTLLTMLAAGVALYRGEFKLGPDLGGGITLIYELADGQTSVEDSETDPSEDPDADSDSGSVNRKLVQRLTDALKQRVDPTGTKEVTIRPYGTAIEIIIPRTGQEDLAFIKRRITSLGQLEFRITADPTWGARDRNIIEQARALGPSEKVVELNGKPVAEWVGYAVEEFGPFEQQDSRVQKRMAGDRAEALVLLDPWNVTGEYLTRAALGTDQRGGPAVDFGFNSLGSRRFGKLTGDNKPNPATGAVRYLGIVLDKRLLSAPSIRQKITGSGQISGGAMSEDEVNFIISILDAGSLPAKLNEEPISEEVISSTLGDETIEKGKYAIAASLIIVLVFMVGYYRAAGVIACGALLTNLLLVLGVMVLINAAFTLPGLAGLVLTVGMSVDANVLIFERIREELDRGAALRMAIRNGFARATSTIVDANLTTLITGFVLYAIGTDQIKGFAVTLILGILMSMYTAIFCARIVFDIAERRRWITKLNMGRLVGHTEIDFIGLDKFAVVCSAVLIAVGIVAVWGRGAGILDIDFTGGTSVTMVLDEGNKMSVAEVRGKLVETELADKNLLVVERGTTNQQFTVNTSVDTVEAVQNVLSTAFAGQLKTYRVDVDDVQPYSDGDDAGVVATLKVNSGGGYDEVPGVNHDSLRMLVEQVMDARGHSGIEPVLTNPNYQTGSDVRFKEWQLRLELTPDEAQSVLQKLQQETGSRAMFPLASKIGGKVAGNMQVQALYAVLVSLLGIVGYIWLRFQRVTFGLAAVVALVHDVLVTLGMIAISLYVVNSVPPLADALQIDAFQISLPIVAAFLTIIGYSLNDTIVVFDRIREVRGKSPNLTRDMINTSLNQTLGRTLLTSLTTLMVVLILYFFGGAGVHGFAFALVVGVIVGTYSSIFVASPALLAMSGTGNGIIKS